MGLLTHTELSEVCARAIKEGLALKLDNLFFGFEQTVASEFMVEGGVPADDLRMVATRLNNNEEPIVEGYLLCIWLRNCAQSTHGSTAKYFEDWADKLLARSQRALPPLPPQLGSSPGPLILALREQMSDYIEALSERANDLMVSKRLHERLHRSQIFVVPMLRSLIGAPEEQAGIWRPLVLQQVSSLDSECDSMENEVATLSADDDLLKLATAITGRLRDKGRTFGNSLQAEDRTARTAALYGLREAIKDGMSELATRIDALVQALELSVLIKGLQKLAGQTRQQELEIKLTDAAHALTAILQDLSALGDQHRAWQRLDNQLWWIEDVFDRIDKEEFFRTTFTQEWAKLGETLTQLGGEPPAAWLEPTRQICALFVEICAMPVVMPIDPCAPGRFQDSVKAIRQEFHKVDQRLLASCVRLNVITTQLASL